jgi:alkylated DNA repair dioxygenase AlkB
MTAATAWLAAEPTVERVRLDAGSWVDVVRGLVADAQQVHDDVLRDARWSAGRTYRYERWVEDERRSASQSGARRHPALAEVETWLIRRYRVRFSGVVLTEYRHGRQSLGFHRDRAMTWLDDTLVALLTLGAQRPWLLRPETGRPVIDPDDALRDAIDIAPASGDLLVMGGRCQKEWLHAVPSVAEAVGSRISAQWRWTSRRGEPDVDPTSRDPRFFSDEPPRLPPTRRGAPGRGTPPRRGRR